VRVDPEDLDVLESMARLKALAPHDEFFFGESALFNDKDKEEVLEFVQKARDAIAQGKAVFYDSCW
jgi:hypothetical protein